MFVVIPRMVLFRVPLTFRMSVIIPMGRSRAFFIVGAFRSDRCLEVNVFSILRLIIFPRFVTVPIFGMCRLVFMVMFRDVRGGIFIPYRFVQGTSVTSIAVTRGGVVKYFISMFSPNFFMNFHRSFVHGRTLRLVSLGPLLVL